MYRAKSESLDEEQIKFTKNLRSDKANEPVKNISDRSMKLYKELVYNNIENTTRKTFPIITKLLSQSNWEALISRFIQEYTFDSPYFYDISKSFVLFLSGLSEKDLCYPFLAELAHYEWIELDVELQRDNKELNIIPEKEDIKNLLVLNKKLISVAPTTRILTYSFPVHKISIDYIPINTSPKPIFLLVYRDLNYNVKFMKANGLTACLIELLIEKPDIIINTIQKLCETLNLEATPGFLSEAIDICLSFFQKNILRFK